MNLESYALYPHQVTGVEFLARRGRAVPADDSGRPLSISARRGRP
jgi:hypothetical protein